LVSCIVNRIIFLVSKLKTCLKCVSTFSKKDKLDNELSEEKLAYKVLDWLEASDWFV
jgi:hypothetical protein